MEYAVEDKKLKHVGSFCDNKSAVEWKYRGSISTSISAARLLRLLSLRQQERKALSLTPMRIAGKENAMADIPSRAFKDGQFSEAQKNLTS